MSARKTRTKKTTRKTARRKKTPAKKHSRLPKASREAISRAAKRRWMNHKKAKKAAAKDAEEVAEAVETGVLVAETTMTVHVPVALTVRGQLSAAAQSLQGLVERIESVFEDLGLEGKWTAETEPTETNE